MRKGLLDQFNDGEEVDIVGTVMDLGYSRSSFSNSLGQTYRFHSSIEPVATVAIGSITLSEGVS